MIPALTVGAVVVVTYVLGSIGVRHARTTSNFFVASRSVHPLWNAFAVCGEAMSAASYLGIPALILVFGADLLFTIIGFTIGFLLLTLFLAAPMRRFGTYTIPEFVEDRLNSPRLRPAVAVMVIVASWLFFLAQLKGAGVVTRELIGAPYWVGVVIVGLLVSANLSAGGMRGITFVQGFQFFVIILGILVPFVAIATLWTSGEDRPELAGPSVPIFDETTTVTYHRAVTVEVSETVVVSLDGGLTGQPEPEPRGGDLTQIGPGRYQIAEGTEVVWPAGSAVPHLASYQPLTGADWAAPFGQTSLGGGHPVYFAYAVMLANMFGIISLPHIVVRFYTNPTGREARRTSVLVLAMIAPYYAMLPLFAAFGRVVAPELLSSGDVDVATVVVPARMVAGLGGELLGAVVAAGAVAAFLSTSSGLVIAMAGSLSHDILSAGVPELRRSTWAFGVLSIGAGLLVESININVLIGWSSAIAASAIGPLLVLGIWWPGFTVRGAMAVILVGGLTTTGSVAVIASGLVSGGWPEAILTTPAAWTVPLAFVAGFVASKLDPVKVPDVAHKMALLHLPERWVEG
jgi:Na+(H+)/acetate symporter ActP